MSPKRNYNTYSKTMKTLKAVEARQVAYAKSLNYDDLMDYLGEDAGHAFLLTGKILTQKEIKKLKD